MRIFGTKKIEADSVLVIALKEGSEVSKHAFFKLLAENDRSLLDSFSKRTDLKKNPDNFVFLPSGKKVLILSLGPKEKFTSRKSLLLMRKLVQLNKLARNKRLEVDLRDLVAKGISINETVQNFAIQVELANFEFVIYKTPDENGWNFLEEIAVFTDKDPRSVQKYLDKGKIIGEEINSARILSNTPGGDMTPEALAEAAVTAGKKAGLKVSVMDENEMRKLGMGGILGVSQGSTARPRFIVMEYSGGPKREKPVVLVGKGITFDSGGLNIKPGDHMNEMHMDMSGGAAVIHVITALSRLKIKKNVIGLVPAAENMPSGESYRPGDVLRTMSGKTIEVNNTDAEGRVILADALTYAQRYEPRLVIDIATLTGAAVVALGQRTSAVFTTDKKIENNLREAGENSGDFVWPLPLWEEYEEDIKGTFGDWSNTGKDKYGGAITAAVFLWQFIKPFPWAHIDIAPRMTSIDGEYLAKGAAGAPVNLLIHFLENF